MRLGEIPSTGDIAVESAVEGGAVALGIAAAAGVFYLGMKAIVTGKNPIARN